MRGRRQKWLLAMALSVTLSACAEESVRAPTAEQNAEVAARSGVTAPQPAPSDYVRTRTLARVLDAPALSGHEVAALPADTNLIVLERSSAGGIEWVHVQLEGLGTDVTVAASSGWLPASSVLDLS